MEREFGGSNVTVHVLKKYTSTFWWTLSQKTQAKTLEPGSELVSFHIGRQHSVGVIPPETGTSTHFGKYLQLIRFYKIFSIEEGNIPKLFPSAAKHIALATGSSDIAFQLRRVLLRKCVDALQKDDRVSGREIVKTIDSILEDFVTVIPATTLYFTTFYINKQ